jgi:hypothetical protein
MYMLMYLIRLALTISCAMLLSGCLGGTVAQQIARSIATSVADKAVANAVEAEEKKDALIHAKYNGVIQQTADDPYRNAMLTGRFATIQPVEEPLPEYPTTEQEVPIVILKTNPLVQVELFNLLIGEEKDSVLEKARLQGALNLPSKDKWDAWNVATGRITSNTKAKEKIITFLIPPEFGKPTSGSNAMVELYSAGDMNIARYKNN